MSAAALRELGRRAGLGPRGDRNAFCTAVPYNCETLRLADANLGPVRGALALCEFHVAALREGQEGYGLIANRRGAVCRRGGFVGCGDDGHGVEAPAVEARIQSSGILGWYNFVHPLGRNLGWRGGRRFRCRHPSSSGFLQGQATRALRHRAIRSVLCLASGLALGLCLLLVRPSPSS